MTYEEIKDKLGKCERSLSALQNGNYASLPQAQVPAAINQLQVMKEELSNQLMVLEQEKTAFVNKTAISYEDEQELRDLKNNTDIDSIKTAKGKKIKETIQENIQISMEQTKAIAKKAGEATLKALKNMGEGISSSKAKRIVPGKFEIFVEFKNGKESIYEFIIDKEDRLHLKNEDFDKMVGQVGVQPSGEAILHVDVVAGNIQRAIKANLRESEVNEAPHQTTYIKFPSHQYKKAMDILNSNIDPTYVKMDIVDNDGDGNVIVYFNFRHEDGFDDMYDDSENQDSEFYQEPDENPESFLYDVVMDLRANDIEMTGMSHDVDDMDELAESLTLTSNSRYGKVMSEEADNSDWAMKIRSINQHGRQMKQLDKIKKAGLKINPNYKKNTGTSPKVKAIIDKLEAKRAQVMRDMEQEAEPQGGPIADKYGDMLNKIDTALEKARGRKSMDYDTAVGKANESFDDDSLFTFGFDLDEIEYVVHYLKTNYSEQDYELHVGRGDTHPNAVTLNNPEMENDETLGDLLDAAKGSDQTDYEDYRREEDDYLNNDLEESEELDGTPTGEGDLDVGHQDDEPSMLKSSAMETAEYSAKLYKKLDKYDKQDGEVDFPHWWQKKLVLAREYMSAAYHYLDSNEKQPAMDQLALESVSEVSLNKIQKSYDQTISIMKDLAKKYKAGDKSVVDQLKTLTITKKKLEKALDDKVSGSGRDQELSINESASRDLDEIFGAIGYRQGFDEFIEDNPGCVEVIMEWIGGISDFQQKLSQEYDNEELENLGFYFGDDEYNESTVKEGRGDLDTIVRVITDMANEDGTTTKEAALEVIEALRDAYMIDAYDEGVIKESLNPEVSKKVAQFIKAMAKRYDYKEQDAVYAIMAALKQRDFDGVNENKILKEFTDNSFKGSELIDDANKRGPDMFGKQIFADLLPKGVASENNAIEALKKHDASGIKARMKQYAPMFVHVQYHELEHEGEYYRMHQTQYYNSNFKDTDPDFNPGVSKITLFKITKKAADRRDKEEKEVLGTILVKTDEYVQDLRNLPGLGKRVSEATRQDLGMSSSVSKRRAKAELKKPGNDGSKVYGLDKDGKRVHIKNINDVDKFKKFELDADINEDKATYCGGCGTTHKKSSGCPKK
jgi:hypothetical protein